MKPSDTQTAIRSKQAYGNCNQLYYIAANHTTMQEVVGYVPFQPARFYLSLASQGVFV